MPYAPFVRILPKHCQIVFSDSQCEMWHHFDGSWQDPSHLLLKITFIGAKSQDKHTHNWRQYY
jgi:hypothetical protein